MSNVKYRPTTVEQAIARVVEECGEVVKEAGKGYRFGWWSHHPRSSETNLQAFYRELRDVMDAASLAIDMIEAEGLLEIGG